MRFTSASRHAICRQDRNLAAFDGIFGPFFLAQSLALTCPRRRCTFGSLHPNLPCDLTCQVLIDFCQVLNHEFLDLGVGDLGEFNRERLSDVLLFGHRQAVIKERRLRVVITKSLTPLAGLYAIYCRRIMHIAVLLRRRFLRRASEGVGCIVGWSRPVSESHRAVLLKIIHWRLGLINRELRKVRGPEPVQLGIKVGEEPALQEGIITHIDPRHHMPRVKGNLLRLGKEIVRIPVQRQLPHPLEGNLILRPNLGRVEDVEAEFVRVFFRHS